MDFIGNLTLSSYDSDPITRSRAYTPPAPPPPSPSCSAAHFLSAVSSFLPYCWCPFPRPGMRRLSRLHVYLSHSHLQCRRNAFSQTCRSRVSAPVLTPRGSLPSRSAGGAGAGSHGSAEGQRCWAEIWGRWVHLRRRAC